MAKSATTKLFTTLISIIAGFYCISLQRFMIRRFLRITEYWHLQCSVLHPLSAELTFQSNYRITNMSLPVHPFFHYSFLLFFSLPLLLHPSFLVSALKNSGVVNLFFSGFLSTSERCILGWIDFSIVIFCRKPRLHFEALMTSIFRPNPPFIFPAKSAISTGC